MQSPNIKMAEKQEQSDLAIESEERWNQSCFYINNYSYNSHIKLYKKMR